MNAAKIRLSAKEMELVTQADWILTKNGIIKKVKDLLGSLVPLQEQIIKEQLQSIIPQEVTATTAKISKGENYQGLPYLVLDHPRYFEKGHVFALRTLFWWGNFFSITLHLSGRYKKLFEQSLLHNYNILLEANKYSDTGPRGGELHVGVNSDEWEHHFEKNNYLPLSEMGRQAWQDAIIQQPFIKLAKKIPLKQWKGPYEMTELLTGHYKSMLEALTDQLPRR